MSWYIKQVGDSSSSKGVEFQVGHYTPDGSWELLVPFIGDAQESEERAHRLVSFLNGSSTAYMIATMDPAETQFTTGDIYEVLAEIRDSIKGYDHDDYGREISEALGGIGSVLVQIEKDLSDPRFRGR